MKRPSSSVDGSKNSTHRSRVRFLRKLGGYDYSGSTEDTKRKKTRAKFPTPRKHLKLRSKEKVRCCMCGQILLSSSHAVLLCTRLLFDRIMMRLDTGLQGQWNSNKGILTLTTSRQSSSARAALFCPCRACARRWKAFVSNFLLESIPSSSWIVLKEERANHHKLTWQLKAWARSMLHSFPKVLSASKLPDLRAPTKRPTKQHHTE